MKQSSKGRLVHCLPGFLKKLRIYFIMNKQMKKRNAQIAIELKGKLSPIIELVDFRVFGSRSRDEDIEYSDLDVFIEVERLDHGIKDRIYDMCWEVGFAHGIVISPLVFSRAEIEHSPMKVSPIVRTILKEGVPL